MINDFRWPVNLDGGATAGSLFMDFVGRAELETIRAVPMDTRHSQIIVIRDLGRRLAGGEAAVDLRTRVGLSVRIAYGH
jgi:hypothetical protein